MEDEIKLLKREIRELSDEVHALRKRKANGDDVEQISQKVSQLEAEVRLKFGSLQSQNGEIQHTLQNVLASLEAIRNDINHQKREVNSLQETQKVSTLQRIPMWAWALMAIGAFAVLQLGLERYAELRGVVP